MTKKFKKGPIIAVSVVAVVVWFGILVAIIVPSAIGRNWSLGLGAQQGDSDINKVQSSLVAIENDAIIDIYVKNSNTSGTPFGHTISVNVLVNSDIIAATDDAAISALYSDIYEAIHASGVKDTYDIYISLDVNPHAVRDPADAPIKRATDASKLYSGYIVKETKLEFK